MKFRTTQPRVKISQYNNEYMSRVSKWHKRFAWVPVKVASGDRTHQEWAVWTTVYQKGVPLPIPASNVRKIKPSDLRWERYTSKDYFKKKLTGELDKDETQPDSDDGDYGGVSVGSSSPSYSGYSSGKTSAKSVTQHVNTIQVRRQQ